MKDRLQLTVKDRDGTARGPVRVVEWDPSRSTVNVVMDADERPCRRLLYIEPAMIVDCPEADAEDAASPMLWKHRVTAISRVIS